MAPLRSCLRLLAIAKKPAASAPPPPPPPPGALTAKKAAAAAKEEPAAPPAEAAASSDAPDDSLDDLEQLEAQLSQEKTARTRGAKSAAKADDEPVEAVCHHALYTHTHTKHTDTGHIHASCSVHMDVCYLCALCVCTTTGATSHSVRKGRCQRLLAEKEGRGGGDGSVC